MTATPGDAGPEIGDTSVVHAVRRAKRRAWLTRVGLLVLALFISVVIVRLIGQIDWGAVWDALRHLTWWQPLVLIVVVVVRQVLNALPLALYIPGVSVVRATVNDLGAILMSAVAPPPSDLALRVGMFNSWGVPTVKGLAGTVMNTLTFYIVRFAAPLFGFILLIATGEPAGVRLVDLVCIAIAAAILVGVLLVVRSDELASTVGLKAGRIACRVRKQVDPEAWRRSCVDFRDQIASRFRHGFPRSLLGLFGMLAADLAVLVLCLRFVGVSAAEVSLVVVAIAYLFAYPLTLFPFSGIGIVDALVLAALVEEGGLEIEAASVAALIVWRVFTVGGPILMGVGAVALWRNGTLGNVAVEKRAAPDVPPEPPESQALR
jgi:putative heme transporter